MYSRMNMRQVAVYECFLHSDNVKKVLMTQQHALASLVTIQKMYCYCKMGD